MPWRNQARIEYSESQSRADAVLITLAGPAASLAGALLALGAMYALENTILRPAFEVIALFGLIVTGFCLIPLTITSNRKAMHTDGKHVVAALQGRRLAKGLQL